jgi:hypothetical protein
MVCDICFKQILKEIQYLAAIAGCPQVASQAIYRFDLAIYFLKSGKSIPQLVPRFEWASVT